MNDLSILAASKLPEGTDLGDMGDKFINQNNRHIEIKRNIYFYDILFNKPFLVSSFLLLILHLNLFCSAEPEQRGDVGTNAKIVCGCINEPPQQKMHFRSNCCCGAIQCKWSLGFWVAVSLSLTLHPLSLLLFRHNALGYVFLIMRCIKSSCGTKSMEKETGG